VAELNLVDGLGGVDIHRESHLEQRWLSCQSIGGLEIDPPAAARRRMTWVTLDWLSLR
jgi:hypothetical protein